MVPLAPCCHGAYKPPAPPQSVRQAALKGKAWKLWESQSQGSWFRENLQPPRLAAAQLLGLTIEIPLSLPQLNFIWFCS